MIRGPTRSTSNAHESITPRFRKPNPKLADRWYEYLDLKTGASPATVDFWIGLANNPPELVGEGTYNFKIRDHRLVKRDDAKQVIDSIRTIMSSVAHLATSVGYETFDHSPFRLFLAVLETVPQGRIRCCVRCDRYFLAKRTDQKACSPECANVTRVMRYRARWRLYEETRKRNRATKKRLKELKEKRRSRELENRSG